MPVYIEKKSGDLVGTDGQTNKQGKIELLSHWTMEGWDEQYETIMDKTDTNYYGSKIVRNNNQWYQTLNVMFDALYLFGIWRVKNIYTK